MEKLDRLEQFRQLLAQSATESHSVSDIAAQVGGSPTHLQRAFTARYGITPKQYQLAQRQQYFKAQLRQQVPVTQALYEAGYGATSRVYENIDQTLGMTPRRYQRGAAGEVISYALADTPLGRMLLAATDRGLCCVQFGEDDAALLSALQREFPQATIDAMHTPSPAFSEWITALNAYLRGEHALPDLPLDVRGTVFQIKVWRYLQQIPAGTHQTYMQVAAAIGHPKAVRAAASACAANRLALLIPCHRVLRGDGGLGGYRWGLDRKASLLDIEQSD
ncbi:bifunctional transcriptional activator/DNA repair enzyme AdaA [Parvibium lacunae]|uniref:methylated-DNA--[protein]-cysteine S-methyltransferase n=1 Tax=Parvibium lacunae TaxID=1888893 RepID=A0A368L3Y2_9BURK|nr:methylated-DNA--[protein]-cysteine S-methyltransferase [Parvibium lacunae]RCS58132.1 methylated-DNA--[protein]-cysteine S-methyltransferase [Parvibium lacunae]